MDHIKGTDRDQLTLFPEALDDYISQENPVRFINAFIDTLDLDQLGFTHAVLQETGRPPYYPGDLLKLYLYGYLNLKHLLAASGGSTAKVISVSTRRMIATGAQQERS